MIVLTLSDRRLKTKSLSGHFCRGARIRTWKSGFGDRHDTISSQPYIAILSALATLINHVLWKDAILPSGEFLGDELNGGDDLGKCSAEAGDKDI